MDTTMTSEKTVVRCCWAATLSANGSCAASSVAEPHRDASTPQSHSANARTRLPIVGYGTFPCRDQRCRDRNTESLSMDLFIRLVKRAVRPFGYEVVRPAPRPPSPFPADASPEDC